MNIIAANLIGKYPSLQCPISSQDPIGDPKKYNIIWEVANNEIDHGKYVHVYIVCKDCDANIRSIISSHNNHDESWEFSDLLNPELWWSNLVRFINSIINGVYSKDAAKDMLNIFRATYPYVCRNLTNAEIERFNSLYEVGLA